VDDPDIVGKVQGQQQLYREASHHIGWDHTFAEPSTETSNSFTVDLENQTNMFPIWAFVLKVVYKMANMVVAK
jgi:hypothetical protein